MSEARGRSTGQRGCTPDVGHRIVTTSSVEKIETIIPAKENHLMSSPYRGLTFTAGGRVHRCCGHPLVAQTPPATTCIGKRSMIGILATPNNHLIGSIDAREDRRMRRPSSRSIRNGDRRPTIGEKSRGT